MKYYKIASQDSQTCYYTNRVNIYSSDLHSFDINRINNLDTKFSDLTAWSEDLTSYFVPALSWGRYWSFGSFYW